MAQVQIQKVRHPHDAILDWMLANPFATLRQMSLATGYGVSWLSVVINSDCFKAAYEERRGPIEVGVMQGISARLNNLAHLAIDQMEEQLTKSNLPIEDTIDAFDKVMKANGYAPNAKQPAPTSNVTNNVFVASRSELAGLRGVILQSSNPDPLPELIEGEVVPVLNDAADDREV